MAQISKQCITCEYFDKDGVFKCEAFPAAIPYDIIIGRLIHDKVIKGQQGTYKYKEK